MEIADYDKSLYDYQTYWSNRTYENMVEHHTLAQLLPLRGASILDLGGSFGRLMDVYAQRFDRSVIYDYSQKALDQARESAKQQSFTSVECIHGDVYKLPFEDNSFDVVIMIRVLHHITDTKAVFAEVKRVLKSKGIFILDIPNKVHLKNRIQHFFKGDMNFSSDQSPEQIGTKTINNEKGIFITYHPTTIVRELKDHGFFIQRKRSILNVRSEALKNIFTPQLLSSLDEVVQPLFTADMWGPQIWVQSIKEIVN